jgi:hypothetical protein
MKLTIPELSFVVLIGVSGSGKHIPQMRDARSICKFSRLDGQLACILEHRFRKRGFSRMIAACSTAQIMTV